MVITQVGLLLAGLSSAQATVSYNAAVAEMIDNVSQDELQPMVDVLSGETPATIGGASYTFTTRSSSSGTAIDNVEQLLYETLLTYGLDSVDYQEFPGERGAPPGRNVIGQIDGTSKASEIVVVGAHMDDYPWTGVAPGADDDASGVSATLYLARAFAGHRFERTVRFAFFGDEENAPWDCEKIGSAGYAASCRAAGEDIVAMIQADSLAYDPPESDEQIVEMNTRRAKDDPEGLDRAIFTVWEEAIATYAITGLTPKNVAISDNWSDHGSFWNNGYPAVMLIEEELENWNPNWHTASDRVPTFDWSFYVQVTRSYVAVTAHLAGVEDAAVDTGSGTTDTGSGTTDTGGRTRKDSCGCGTSGSALTSLGLVLVGMGVGVGRRRRVRGVS